MSNFGSKTLPMSSASHNRTFMDEVLFISALYIKDKGHNAIDSLS